MGLNTIQFIDGTLREGDQTAGVWFSPDDKLSLFQDLQACGVSVVDAGMPAVGPQERALLRQLSALPHRKTRVAASIRALPQEVEMAKTCGVDEVFIIFPISERHRLRIGRSWEDWLLQGEKTLRAAHAMDLGINLVLEDASRANDVALERGIQLARRLEAQRIMLCDTVGVLTPSLAQALVVKSKNCCGDTLKIGTHFHDDYGMATANTLAAIEAGATWPSVTVNGLGERAGNAPLAEVAAACAKLLQRQTPIRLEAMLPLSRRVEARSGMLRAPNAPVVGERTFMHESGIHVHGILKDPHNYEGLTAEAIGRQREIILGKHSGKAGLKAKLEDWKIPHSAHQLDALLAAIKAHPSANHSRGLEDLLEGNFNFIHKYLGHDQEAILRLLNQLEAS